MRSGYGFEVILNSISIRIFVVHSRLDLIILTNDSGSRDLSFDTINQRLRDRLSLRREIEPSSVHAVLDFNNPEVGVKGDLSFEPRLGFVGIDQRPRGRPGEHPVDAARRQLLTKPLGYFGCRRQAVRALKLSQRLLGCGPLLPVWLDGVTKFGQRGLGGQGQARGIAAGFPCQQFGDRIRPWGRTPRALSLARRRKSSRGL